MKLATFALSSAFLVAIATAIVLVIAGVPGSCT